MLLKLETHFVGDTALEIFPIQIKLRYDLPTGNSPRRYCHFGNPSGLGPVIVSSQYFKASKS